MKFFAHIESFLKDEEGASGIEYALIAVMVAVAITTVSTPVSTAVKKIFGDIKTALAG
jgi:pilus assembly protein Flp/PilA